ncbi:MAG: OmpA family protein [Planctomycetes bacterium]|nr:OmpA family protein [Planctomycetota bacterium]
MRSGNRMVAVLGAGLVLGSIGGCVSLDDHRRLQATHRNVLAEKEQLATELLDARSAAEMSRSKLGHLEREHEANRELTVNLRDENDLLNKLVTEAERRLTSMAENSRLGDIVVTGPKLPQPLHHALEQFAAAHPGQVDYDPKRGTVKWKSDLLFALGSDVVRNPSKRSLNGFSEVLKSSSAERFEIIVVGHTDSRPISSPRTRERHPTNWHLSAHRAISVAQVLLKAGYDKKRVGVMGCGEYRPIADNATEKGASANRRVEIYIVPTGSIVATADAGVMAGEDVPSLSRTTP